MFHLFSVLWLIAAAQVNSENKSNMVSFTPNKEVQVFRVPISKEPILSWMDVGEGLYPNITSIKSEIQIGSSLSILIYFYDKSGLYDMFVSKCLATNKKELADSEKMFILFDKVNDIEDTYSSGKITKWEEEKNIDKYTSLFYSNFTSFKFPDEDNLFLTCHIELCYEECRGKAENSNKV